MKVPFTKMHGLGNDFVVFDFTQQSIPISKTQAAAIADRKTGVGCDQILMVEQSPREEIDFRYRIINADGSEVSQCGNGARCFALFVHNKKLSTKTQLRVETGNADMLLSIDPNTNFVTVDMGIPQFGPQSVPIDAPNQQDWYEVSLPEQSSPIKFQALSVGNPHAVITVEDTMLAPVQELGKALESHSIFPDKANIGFFQPVDKTRFKLRVFERGVGETSACGSGACAAAIAGIRSGQLSSSKALHAELTGGELIIEWAGEGSSVVMHGPAVSVFDGEIDLSS